jgi:hypothetical protein
MQTRNIVMFKMNQPNHVLLLISHFTLATVHKRLKIAIKATTLNWQCRLRMLKHACSVLQPR